MKMFFLLGLLVIFTQGKECELKLCKTMTNCPQPQTENIEMWKGVALYGNTEPPFTGKYTDSNETGTYTCSCCGQKLFHSHDKYTHNSGWVAFSQAIKNSSMYTANDTNYLKSCVQPLSIYCKHCGIHLGKMDDDNETFLINSVCLDFHPEVKTVTADWASYATLIGASFVIAVTMLLSVFIAFAIKNTIFPQMPISTRSHDNELRVMQDLDGSSQEDQTIFDLEEDQEKEVPKARTSLERKFNNVITYEKKEL